MLTLWHQTAAADLSASLSYCKCLRSTTSWLCSSGVWHMCQVNTPITLPAEIWTSDKSRMYSCLCYSTVWLIILQHKKRFVRPGEPLTLFCCLVLVSLCPPWLQFTESNPSANNRTNTPGWETHFLHHISSPFQCAFSRCYTISWVLKIHINRQVYRCVLSLTVHLCHGLMLHCELTLGSKREGGCKLS